MCTLATSPHVSASGWKKVKAAWKPLLLTHTDRCDQLKEQQKMSEIPLVIHVYSLHHKRKERNPSFFEKLILNETQKVEGNGEEGMESVIVGKKQRTVGGNEEMELRVDIITIDDQLGLGETQNYVKKINSKKKWNLDSKVNTSVSLTKRKNTDGVRLGNGLKYSEAVRIKKWVWLSLKVLIPRNLLVCNVRCNLIVIWNRCSGHWMWIVFWSCCQLQF